VSFRTIPEASPEEETLADHGTKRMLAHLFFPFIPQAGLVLFPKKLTNKA
jgi:hypothetical protein